MWNLEQEDSYYKIYDERKTLVGYFAPEYGEIRPAEKADQVIKEMLEKHDSIKGGYMMLPMTKFGIFEDGKEMSIDYVERKLNDAYNRIMLWRNLMVESAIDRHKITVSHTDHDMISITLGITFPDLVPLEKKEIQKELGSILDLAHQKNLL